jgi:uncharacterized membrane protein YhaH (DUF805 family)
MRELPTLGFVEAVKLASSRILDFKGRSRRSEFWWWMLIILVANWVFSLFISDLLVSSIISTIVMFFGLAATARRLQDADKSAWWVYISYALGIANNIFVATSPAMNKLMDEAKGGFMNEKAIQKIFASGASDFGISFIIGLLFFIFALIVFFMCLKDSEPQTTEHGDSPKYVYD